MTEIRNQVQQVFDIAMQPDTNKAREFARQNMVVQSLVANDSQFLKLTVRYLQACSTEAVGVDG